MGHEANLVPHDVRNADPVGFAAAQGLGKNLIQRQGVARDNGVLQRRGQAVCKHLAAIGHIPAGIFQPCRREKHHQHDKHQNRRKSAE